MKAKKNEKDSQELKNQLARALADYDNLRKRVEKEREEIVRLAGISLFARLLPTIDALEKAQVHIKDEGLEHILGEMYKALKEEQIVRVDTKKGDTFDENINEVVEIESTKGTKKNGKISEVLLTGWQIKDGPVIRPAKVRVYKKE